MKKTKHNAKLHKEFHDTLEKEKFELYADKRGRLFIVKKKKLKNDGIERG